MGPIWDFNLAFANADYCDGANILKDGFITLIHICPGDIWQVPFWWGSFNAESVF